MIDFLRERASWYEVAALLLGLVALYFNARGLVHAVRERDERRDSGQNGATNIVADWSVSNNIGYTTVQACFIFVYLVLIALPPSPRADVVVLRVVAILLFLSAQGVLLVTALRSERFRHRVFAYQEPAQGPRVVKVTTHTVIEPAEGVVVAPASGEGEKDG